MGGGWRFHSHTRRPDVDGVTLLQGFFSRDVDETLFISKASVDVQTEFATHSSAGIHIMLSSLTHILGRLSTFMSVDPRINPLLFRNASGDYIFGNFTDKLVKHINQCWSCLSLVEPGLFWNVKMKATIFQLSMTNSKIKWIKNVFHIHSSGVTQRDEHTLDWLPPQPLTLRMEDDLFKGSWCPSRSVTSSHSLSSLKSFLTQSPSPHVCMSLIDRLAIY